MKFAKHSVDNETRFCRVKRTGRKNTRVIWLVTGEDYLVPTADLEIITAEEAGVETESAEIVDLPPLPEPNLTGEEVRQLMTGHQITIKKLAERLGVHADKVREARRDGVEGMLLVHEWKQAITGNVESDEEVAA